MVAQLAITAQCFLSKKRRGCASAKDDNRREPQRLSVAPRQESVSASVAGGANKGLRLYNTGCCCGERGAELLGRSLCTGARAPSAPLADRWLSSRPTDQEPPLCLPNTRAQLGNASFSVLCLDGPVGRGRSRSGRLAAALLCTGLHRPVADPSASPEGWGRW